MANSAIVGTLKAVLSADVAEFTRAMSTASAEVKELGNKLQKDLEPRQRAVNAAVRDFLGGNEIRRAQEYALAIDKIGDVTKLTAADQLKVNKAVGEALLHYKALGAEAPAHLVKLHKETQQVDTSMGRLTGTVKGVAGALGLAFSGAALVSGLKSLISSTLDYAGEIQDLSTQLGISAEATQRFKFAADQTGSSLDAVGRSITFMNKTLSGGGASTVQLLDEIGLSFTDIRRMKPEDAFTTIAEAIRQIPDPMRQTEVATKLLGKTAAELLPAIKEGFVDIGNSVDVMSAETIKQLDDAKDAWEKLGHSVTIVTGKFISDAFAAKDGWSLFIQDFIASAGNATEMMIQMERTRQRLRNEAVAPAFMQSPAGADRETTQFATRDYVKQLEEARQKVAELTAEQRIQLKAAREVGDGYQDLANELGLNAAALKIFEASTKTGTSATNEQADALKNLTSGLDDLTEQQYEQIATLIAAGKAESDIAKAYGFTAQQVKEVGAAEKEHLELSKKLAAANDAIRKKNLEDAKARQQAADNLNATLADLTDAEIDLIAAQVRAGKSTKDIALVYGFTEEQIRLVIDAEKDLSAVLKKVEEDAKRHHKVWADQFKATLKLEDEVDDLRAKRTLSSTAFQKREIEKWAANQKANFDQTKGDYDRFADAVDARAAELTLALNESWTDAFDQAADGFQQLAQIAGDELSGIVRAIGTVTSSLSQIGKGAEQIGKGGFANTIAGAASVYGSVWMIGTVVDSFRTPEFMRVMRDVGERWGVEITGGMAKAIQASKGGIAKEISGSGDPFGQRRADEELRKRPEFSDNAAKDALREVAELLHLADVIADAGGLTAANAREWETRARDLFDVVALGGKTGAQAVDELSDVVRLFADQATKTGGLWSAAFQSIIADARAAGLELDGLTEAIDAQLNTAASATSKIVGGFVSTLPDLPEGEREEGDDEKIAAIVADTQAQFDRVSRIALASFNAMVANGRSAAEAIAMIGPSIDELGKKAEAFGFAGSEAFNQLSRWRDLTAQNQGLLDQVSGLNELMVALGNVGALDIATFQDLQAEGVEAFEQLTAAGFSSIEAETQIAPLLENIIRLHDERGLAIDEETQALINQAREHGLLQAEEISTNDILIEGIGALIELLGGELPRAWRDMADDAADAAGDVQDSLNRIRPPSLTIPVYYDIPDLAGARQTSSGPNDPHGGIDHGNLPQMALGGYVPPRPGGTAVNIGEAGQGEWVIPEDILQAWNQPPDSDVGSMFAQAAQESGSNQSITVEGVENTFIGQIYLDGRKVGEGVFPHIPVVAKRHRVDRL